MLARTHPAHRTESLQSLVARIYDANNRDRTTSVDALVLEIRKRPSLHEQIYRYAAEDLISKRIGADRRTVLAGGDIGSAYAAANDGAPIYDTHESMPSYQGAASVKARAAATRRFAAKLTGLYLTQFLWNGRQVILGNATPEELQPIARSYQEQGATMVRRARWLETIISAAKTGRPIHQSVTLKELERLQRQADASDV